MYKIFQRQRAKRSVPAHVAPAAHVALAAAACGHSLVWEPPYLALRPECARCPTCAHAQDAPRVHIPVREAAPFCDDALVLLRKADDALDLLHACGLGAVLGSAQRGRLQLLH
eukprot:363542-Chlamydomonas_euryale.AAC.7